MGLQDTEVETELRICQENIYAKNLNIHFEN